MARDILFDHDGAALGHDLALDHARNDRIAREMSPGEEFVFLDGVLAMRKSFFVNLGLVDEVSDLRLLRL